MEDNNRWWNDEDFECLLRFLRGKGFEPQVAEDFADECVNRYLRCIELGRIIENPQAFLLHLAHFVLKECFRNPTRVKYVPDPVSEDPRAWKSQEQTRQQFPDVSAVVADQLSKLTPPLRFMVELVGLRGMEVSDAARLAAEIRKIQPETARSHWYRAKSQLSRSLSTKITHRT